MVYDIVNLANDLPIEDASKYKVLQVKRETLDEKQTIRLISNTLKLVKRMTSNSSSSLGLHPAVYFYSENGRYLPTAVLAMAALIVELERAEEFIRFCMVRKQFEEFLLYHKDYINQISRKARAMWKAFRSLSEYFVYVIECIEEGCCTSDQIEKKLGNSEKWGFFEVAHGRWL